MQEPEVYLNGAGAVVRKDNDNVVLIVCSNIVLKYYSNITE